MSVTCRRLDTMDFDVTARSSSMTTVWIVERTPDENEAWEAIRSGTPVLYGRLVRTRIKPRHLGGGLWMADVEYGTVDPNSAPGVTPVEPAEPGPDDPLDPTQTDPAVPSGGTDLGLQKFNVSIDLTAGTRKVTQSIFTNERIALPGSVAPNHKGAIGVGKDGNVEGCEIFDPKFEFTVGVTRPARDMTLKYLRLLTHLVAHTNIRPFWGFARSELLYLGASGEFVGDGKWTLSHKFAAGENWEPGDPRCEIVPGNPGMRFQKGKGAWDYIWVQYGIDVDLAAGRNTQIPIAAYCEVVYPDADFTKIFARAPRR